MREGTFNGYKVHLVESVEELNGLRELFDRRIMVGIDTETKGLEYKEEQVVGVCVSGGKSYGKEDYRGYYIPVRHFSYDNNLPVTDVIEFTQWLVNNYQTVWFNRNFDLSMLEYDGLKVPFVGNMHEAQVMAFLLFNDPYPSLKDYATKILKWNMISFAENEAVDHNFGTVDPTTGFIYGAGDPISTVMLARKMWNDYPYIRRIYKIDNYVTEAIRRMTQTELHLDYDFLKDEKCKSEEKLQNLKQQIYQLSGVYGFNINSAQAKADILSRFVTLTEKTDKGAWKLDEVALYKIDHPLAKLFAEYSKAETHLGSFVSKMCNFEGTTFRGNYNAVVVPSGRLSSSASKGNKYFSPINQQNIPKTEMKMFLHPHPELGYCLKEEEEGCIKDSKGSPVRIKTKSGLRNAYTCPPPKDGVNYYWVTSDFSGQEVRLAANLSKEPNFLEPLREGKDLHTNVAEKMLGYSNPENRTMIKTANFACLYGADAYTIAPSIGKTIDEAKVFMKNYKETLSKLYAWKAEIIKIAKKKGYSETIFGRPIYLAKYLSSGDRKKLSYAERLAVNVVLQGCVSSGTYLPPQNGSRLLQPMSVFSGDRVDFRNDNTDGSHTVGVPSFQGKSNFKQVVFRSGDFVTVTDNHKFLKWDKKNPVYLIPIDETFDSPVSLVKPNKKMGFMKTFFGCFTEPLHTKVRIGWTYLISYAGIGRPIPSDSPKIARVMLFSWLFRKRIRIGNAFGANSVRSICDWYGWNLVKVGKDTKTYILKWGRRNKSRARYAIDCGMMNSMSPTMLSGHQVYPLNGFVHKNTGADLIRLSIIKCEMERIKNKEWRDSVVFRTTVHDELNNAVLFPYLGTYYKKVNEMMTFHPKEFEIPLTVDTGVGTTWGDCLDIVGIDSEGKLIPKDYKPEN